MSTTVRRCPICEQRFVVDEVHQITCSARCRLARQVRFSAPPPAFRPWFPTAAQSGPHRVSAALVETRAAVAALLTEGRRARLMSTNGDASA